MIHVWSGHDSPYILSEECSAAEAPVVAAVIGQARLGARVLMAACARAGRLGGTPGPAQPRCGRPNGQRQHDREHGYSKHLMLGYVAARRTPTARREWVLKDT